MKSYYCAPVTFEVTGILYTTLFFFFLFTQTSFAQNQSYPFEFFTANIEGTKLSVITPEQKLIFQKEFVQPASHTSDMDEDGVNEMLIIDSVKINGGINFILFIYNTLDSFYLADSINSGSFLPYETASEETEGLIIVTGNPSFEIFNKGVSDYFLPINCWKYENAALSLINDEIYDIFISENEYVVDYIDKFYLENGEDCNSSLKIKPAIAAAFVNYINAGEQSVASKFFKNYYLCDDIEEIENQIHVLLNKGSE